MSVAQLIMAFSNVISSPSSFLEVLVVIGACWTMCVCVLERITINSHSQGYYKSFNYMQHHQLCSSLLQMLVCSALVS